MNGGVSTGRFIAVCALMFVFVLGMFSIAVFMPTQHHHSAPPVDQRIQGVPGCNKDSVRVVRVPAGTTVAFSCPTHIEIVSMDEHTDTVLAFRRPPKGR